MHESELFPLESVPSWVRIVILREFNGRRPSIREISGICDRSWLAVPGIGRTALAIIREATGDQQPLSVNRSVVGMSDAELLTCLESLQEGLKSLSELLNAALSPAPKKGFRSGRVRRKGFVLDECRGLRRLIMDIKARVSLSDPPVNWLPRPQQMAALSK